MWLKGTLADCVFLFRFGQKILNLPKTQQNKRWVLKTAKIKQQLDDRMNFRRTSKGGAGESFLVQKNTLQILKLYTGLFEHEIDRKKSNFRVQCMFFSIIVMRKIKKDTL